MSIAGNVETVRKIIEKSCSNSGLSAAGITFLAASKGQAAPIIREAIAAGITDFGENRVQEAQDKWPGLRKAFPAIRLHLIGPLQTNKAAEAVALFDVIQTIDRVKLADHVADAVLKTGRKIDCFIQVNTGKEPQKAGVLPEEADRLIDYCKTKTPLSLVGLMCIPPAGQPPAPHFAFLRSLATSHGLGELSMGMSDDFETALRLGSTCVRLGRALFGERK